MIETVFQFLGGIGLFLLGMAFLSEGLIGFGSGVLKTALSKFTGSPFKAFLSGALGTAILQSSTATTVTLIGFVSAGLLSFSQAIGVVIGSSLGNTATGWIVAAVGLKINLGFYTLPLIGIGAFMRIFFKKKLTHLGLAFSGFGMMFLGISTLQAGMSGITDLVDLGSLPSGGILPSLLTAMVGLVMTLLLQSSTAAVATTLTALHTNAISFDQAAVLVVGAAIGTTITGSLSAIGGSIYAKRTAVAYILFNVIAGLMAICMLPVLFKIIHWAEEAGYIANTATSLAAFHTLFILIGVIVVLPFVNKLAKLVERLLPVPEGDAAYLLDSSLLTIAPVALEASQKSLQKALESLFERIKHLNEKNPDKALHDIHKFDQNLQQIYSFVGNIVIDSNEKLLLEKRLAQFHLLEHLQLLKLSITEACKSQIDPGWSTAADLSYEMKSNLMNAVSALSEYGADNEIVLRSYADRVAQLTRKTRHELISSTALHGYSENAALGQTDMLRGYEKVSHHLWKCVGYFDDAREAAQKIQQQNKTA